jgi:hypothetical protein
LYNELLYYHPDETKSSYINRIGLPIWQLCDGQFSVAEIIKMLNEAYPQDAEAIPTDIVATSQQSEEYSLIEEEEPALATDL